MGTAVLLTAAPPNICSTSGHGFSSRSNNQSNTTSWCCFSTKYGGRTSGSQWEKGTTETHNEQPRYNDEFFSAQNYDDEEDFWFRSAVKQRIWWSDDSSSCDDCEDEEEEAGPDYGFGLLEGSFGFSSIFKVFRAFGWMVPAIIISMLAGTGTNAFFMALALPLVQSALSLVVDTLWGRSARGARPKSRTKRRAYAGAASNSKAGKGREQNNQSGNRVDDFKSWTSAENFSAEKGKGRTKSFGGWDELDKQGRTEEVLNPASGNEKRQSDSGKLSRRVRNRPTPLLVRLLVAFFPFLGFWTKLL